MITALGLHPQLAHERKGELPLFDRILPGSAYVGEVGLDGAPEFKNHWQDQVEVFRHVLNACNESGGRVMSIHSRRASTPVLDLLEQYPGSGTPILHWFTGTVGELNRAISMGCWFSVGPAMLKSKRGKDLVMRMPRERVLTESDGPFAQLGGRSVFPWEVDVAIDALTECWDCDVGEVSQVLDNNLNMLMSFDKLKCSD
jgi:TatD DNase family protein